MSIIWIAGTREQLVGSATGGGGGRGAKGRRRGPSKSDLRKFKTVRLGEGMYGSFCCMMIFFYIAGKEDVRWGGLSFPMIKPRDTLGWLNNKDMGKKCVRSDSNLVQSSFLLSTYA